MIESITAREAESLFNVINEYTVKPSDFKMVDPFESIKHDKFSKKWIMVKDEYITAGDSNEIPKYFWAKRARSFPYSWFNRNLKGANRAVETECVSFTIDIPFTSHRSFLKLFLLIDEEANTENYYSEQHNIFDVELVKVLVFDYLKYIYTYLNLFAYLTFYHRFQCYMLGNRTEYTCICEIYFFLCYFWRSRVIPTILLAI